MKGNKTKGCGTGYDLPCSELFKQEYDVDRLKVILLYLSKEFKYNEYFREWPREKENPKSFDRNYFNNEAKGLYEWVHRELKKQKNNRIDNFSPYVSKIINGYIMKTINPYLRNIHKFQFTNDDLELLQLYLYRPDLTIDDIKILANESHSVEEMRLKDDIKKIPGYRNAWFKIETRDGERKLFVCKTQPDIDDEYRYITITRRDLGHRRGGKDSEFDQFNRSSPNEIETHDFENEDT